MEEGQEPQKNSVLILDFYLIHSPARLLTWATWGLLSVRTDTSGNGSPLEYQGTQGIYINLSNIFYKPNGLEFKGI